MKRLHVLLATLALALLLPVSRTYAYEPTDEILDYEIVVSVRDDAQLDMQYFIEWKVLDSDSLGPLSWISLGLPNEHWNSCVGVTDTVTRVKANGSYAEIYLDKDYYEGETVYAGIELVQDYLYELNALTEGEAVYYFTPGWFDDIEVDNITIKWEKDKALSWSHGAIVEEIDGTEYLVWQGSLEAGELFDEVSVTYSSDAFAFDDSKYYNDDDYYSYSDDYDYDYGYDYNYNYNSYNSYDFDDEDNLAAFAAVVIFIVVIIIIMKALTSYNNGAGLSAPKTVRQVKRTLITYYPECPGCGAARPENSEKCEYCGRSFIKSEEVVEEKDVKDAYKYKDEGVYRYGDTGNTYVRVHVTHVAPPRPSCAHSSCAHSSCAHSSCACAHSCACACACACAGGGRAGCSTKDFYNTSLKLKQLQLKKR